jgi:hypothetical protein
MGCSGGGAPVSGVPDVDVVPFSQQISSPSKVGIKRVSYMVVCIKTHTFSCLCDVWKIPGKRVGSTYDNVLGSTCFVTCGLHVSLVLLLCNPGTYCNTVQ